MQKNNLFFVFNIKQWKWSYRLLGVMTLLFVPIIGTLLLQFNQVSAFTNDGTSWPQVQGDAHRSGYVSQTLVGPFTEEWRTCSKRHWASFKEEGMTDEQALDACTQKVNDYKADQTPARDPVKVLPPLGEDPHVDSSLGVSYRVQPIVVGGLIYIPSNNGVLYAFNESNGQIAWRFPAVDSGESPAGAFMASAAYMDGRIYVGSADSRLYVVDAQDGSFINSYQTNGMIRSAPLVVDSDQYNDAGFDKRVFIGSRDGKMYAFDQDGNLEWEYDTGAPIEDTAAYDDNRIFFGGMNSRAYALDASNGTSLWTDDDGMDGRKIPSGQGFRDRWTVARDGKAYFSPIPARFYHDVIAAGTVLFHSDIYQAALTYIAEPNDKNKAALEATTNDSDILKEVELLKNGNGSDSKLRDFIVNSDDENDLPYQKSWSESGGQRDTIVDFLKNNPENRVLYTLDAASGQDYFSEPEPILYYSGGGSSAHVPPVLLPDGKAMVNYRRTFKNFTVFGATTAFGMYAGYLTDSGDGSGSATADIETFTWCEDKNTNRGECRDDPDAFKGFHTSDESDSLMMAGETLFMNHSREMLALHKEKGTSRGDGETKYRGLICNDGSCGGEKLEDGLVVWDDYDRENPTQVEPGWRFVAYGDAEEKYLYSEANSDGNNSAGIPVVVVNDSIYALHYNSLVKLKGTQK